MIVSNTKLEGADTSTARRYPRGPVALCVAFLVACLLVLVPAGKVALAEESATDVQTVRVGYYESHGFLEGAADGVPKSGYGYEYMQRAASYAGWHLEYVYGSWNELYEKLANGEIDMLPGVSRIGTHIDAALFPSVSMLCETFYVYRGVFDDSLAGNDIGSFSGKRIGVVSDSNSEINFDAWYADNGCDAQVVRCASVADMRQAFNAGELDAFVSSDNIAHDFEGVIPVEIVGKEPYYLAISKNRSDLLGKLNDVQSIMNSQDRAFLNELQIRYAADSAASAYLTPAETAWIENTPTLTVGYVNNYLPYCDTDKNGNATGLMVDVLSAALDSLPVAWEPDITFKAFDDQRDLFDALKSGEVDLAFPVGGETWYAEANGFLQSSAVVSPSMELVFCDDRDFSDAAARIAVNKHNLLQQNYVKTYFPDADLVECESITDCLSAVRDGRANGTIVNGLRAGALLNSQTHLVSAQLPASDDRCFGVMQGNGTLLQIINRGLGIIGENYGTNVSYHYTEGLFTYTLGDFVRDNWVAFAVAAAIVAALIVALAVRHFRRMRAENQREIEQNRRLEEALAQAERASKAKDVLLGNLSHDIRTPLNGILGVMDVNASCADDQQVKDNMQKAKRAANQLLCLVDDLLEMSELKSGAVEIGSESFALAPIVDDVLADVCEQAKEAGVSVVCADAALDGCSCSQVPGAAARFLGDAQVIGSPVYVRKVLFNVFDNAVRYNVSGGSVAWSVSLEPAESGRVLFTCTVRDTGEGMSEEYLTRLFEPFSQARATARSLYPGSGLGMPIARSLVELMGGSIDVQSTLGKGTQVVVRIPFSLDQRKGDAAGARDVRAGVAGMHILLAEDNDLNREITQCVLEREGAKVLLARDGAQALAAFKAAPTGSIDAVVMDVMMPVMNGLEATRAIRGLSRPDAQSVPIIAMTANAFEEDRKKALDAGMNEHLGKPVDSARLIAVLARCRRA